MAKNKGGKASKGVDVVVEDIVATDIPAAETADVGGAEATAEPTPGDIRDNMRAEMRAGWVEAGATHHYQTNGVCYAGGIVRDEEEGSITVLPGSRLVDAIPTSDKEATEKSLANGRRYRSRLVGDGIIEKGAGGWVFVARHTFPSRSTAACVIGGVVVNGKTAWRGIGDGFGRKPRAEMTAADAVVEIHALMAKFGLTVADIG